jgi:predicted peptidase
MPISDHQYRSHDLTIGYKLFLPEKDTGRDNAALPLILFLHGIKMRGNDLSVLEDYGLIRVAKQNKRFPYVIIAPQCPANRFWPDIRGHLLELVEQIVQAHAIDRNRIYVTGFSMGGEGTWDLAANARHVFAAAAPISGGYPPGAADRLVAMPVWAFHGALDDVVPISDTEAIINAIKSLGGEPRFTTYPDLDHGHIVMFKTYENPELYAWFEQNRLDARGVASGA